MSTGEWGISDRLPRSMEILQVSLVVSLSLSRQDLSRRELKPLVSPSRPYVLLRRSLLFAAFFPCLSTLDLMPTLLPPNLITLLGYYEIFFGGPLSFSPFSPRDLHVGSGPFSCDTPSPCPLLNQ